MILSNHSIRSACAAFRFFGPIEASCLSGRNLAVAPSADRDRRVLNFGCEDQSEVA